MILLGLVFLVVHNHAVEASLGDRLVIYQNHLQRCIRKHCTTLASLNEFHSKQTFFHKLFAWDCHSECKYQAQWYTIDEFAQDNIKIPQFYGKWTFYRFLGIQEPASFLFSLMNFLSNLIGWIKYSKLKTDPYYNVWKIHTLITLHAWLWSTVFHARETSFAEKMDYFSAYSVVLYSLFSISTKLICDSFNLVDLNLNIFVTIFVPFCSFYLYHIYYLYFVYFDYGYNMKVNVITGLISSFAWMFWCFKNRKTRKHVRKCFIVLISVNLFLLLELFDFPPFVFVFDAHSIWHMSTAPLPLLWFSFLQDEAIYLSKDWRLFAQNKKSI